MKFLFAIFVVATSICAGDPDGDQEGAKMIAAVSKELNELKKQVSQQKVEIEEQRADRRQLHKDVANLKDENMEFRKTQAILRDAEIKLHEADNEFRVADARIFKDTEKEAEKNRQAAPARQIDDIVVAAKELILSEIKRYHGTHNDTTALKKLIDAEIQRLMAPKSMVETVFVGGTPDASSFLPGFPAEMAFKPYPGHHKYHQYSWTSKFNEPPAYIWYDFKRQLRPAKISYLPRKSDVSNANAVRVKRFQFVGTNDPDCSKNSNWRVFCGGESALYESIDDERGCTIPVKQNMGTFHCLGLRSLVKPDTPSGEVSLRGIRIWIYQ